MVAEGADAASSTLLSVRAGALVARGPQPVAPRGVAIARRLLVDGTTPVYARAPAVRCEGRA